MVKITFSDLLFTRSLVVNIEYTGIDDKDKDEQLFRVRISRPTSLYLCQI